MRAAAPGLDPRSELVIFLSRCVWLPTCDLFIDLLPVDCFRLQLYGGTNASSSQGRS